MVRMALILTFFASLLGLMAFTSKSNDVSSSSYQIQDTSKMVRVEGGKFMMGSNMFPNEEPVHEVILSDFYIDKYEVTVGEYRAYCGQTGAEMPKEPAWGWNDKHPIVNVSWGDAMAYAKWMGKRLPTESEWEYAARGGKKGGSFIYAGGNYPETLAWFKRNTHNGPEAVGKKAPNGLGIYDMSGNVWEWCSDFYNYYPASKQENPKGAEIGATRVMRGGSWYDNRGTLRIANRHYHVPQFGSNMIGFRLVKDVE